MTWTEALEMHRRLGHEEFTKMALEKDMWPIFVTNVCTDRHCKEANLYPNYSKEN